MHSKECGKCKLLSNKGNCTYLGLFVKIQDMKVCPRGKDYQKLMAKL